MIPLHPRSTLFPYTTLFRSLALEGGAPPSLERVARDRRASRDSRRQDRKSTRLNSSHLGISYAVFCLKKKKQKKMIHIIKEVYTNDNSIEIDKVPTYRHKI